jgi:anti-sigma regulatory factor (Ser/Thr protein kinase)
MTSDQPFVSHLTLAATPSAPFWARRHLADVLGKWEFKELIDLGELVVSELVTNGAKASGGEIDAGRGERFEPAEAEVLRHGGLWSAEGPPPARRPAPGERSAEEGRKETEGTRPRAGRLSCTQLLAVPVVRLRLSADQAEGTMLVEVWDKNPQPPRIQPPDLEREGGRGLFLVEAVCRRWGWWWPESEIRSARAWPGAQPAPRGRAGGAGETGRFGKVVWGLMAKDPAQR